MKNLNLSIRFKNKTFVMSLCTTIIAFVYQILSLFDIVPSISQEQILNLIGVVITLLAGLGILVDPTTPGMKDSELVMSRKNGGD